MNTAEQLFRFVLSIPLDRYQSLKIPSRFFTRGASVRSLSRRGSDERKGRGERRNQWHASSWSAAGPRGAARSRTARMCSGFCPVLFYNNHRLGVVASVNTLGGDREPSYCSRKRDRDVFDDRRMRPETRKFTRFRPSIGTCECDSVYPCTVCVKNMSILPKQKLKRFSHMLLEIWTCAKMVSILVGSICASYPLSNYVVIPLVL